MVCQPEKWDARSVVWVSTRGEIVYKFLNCLVCFSTLSCHSALSMLCLGDSSPLFLLATRDTCILYFHFVVLIVKSKKKRSREEEEEILAFQVLQMKD